jgi:hypothetical protein
MSPGPYLKPYAVWERLQLSLYFVQETSIGLVYVYEIMRMLKPHAGEGISFGPSTSGGTSRKWRSENSRMVLKHLVYISLLIVALDVSLLVTEYIGHYEIQVIYKVSPMLFLSHPLICTA